MIDAVKNVGGFQGSETTGVEVRFYPQGGDPVVVDQEPIGPSGRLRYDLNPSVISVNTNEQLGAPSGSWSVTLKEGKRHYVRGLFDELVDDDWVDISFYRFGKRWHVMRGLIDDVRRVQQAGLGKATSRTWTVSGRSFGSIWEKTPIWFNVWSDENVSGAVSSKVFSSIENVLGTPPEVVEGFLFGFLRELGSVGRATWAMPKGMPNVGSRFIDSFEANYLGYPNVPRLIAISPNWLCPQGNLWALAKEWSDPMFNELLLGLYAKGSARPDFELEPGKELQTNNSKMYVILRERPFPTLTAGRGSPWFSLPTWVIPRQMVVTDSLGKSGMERYNAYFVAPQLVQEVLQEAGIEGSQPLWDPDDILRHGLRRLDISTKYTSPEADLAGLSSAQRLKVRDWYCLNPYLLNGSLEIAIGIPSIRPGVRLRVAGAQTKDDDITFYVESIAHNWAFGAGIKTSLGVTRGWVGTDDTYLNKLNEVAFNYRVANRAAPKEYVPAVSGGVG
jgi:hypothetical protein